MKRRKLTLSQQYKRTIIALETLLPRVVDPKARVQVKKVITQLGAASQNRKLKKWRRRRILQVGRLITRWARLSIIEASKTG